VIVRVSVTSRSHLSQWYSYTGLKPYPGEWQLQLRVNEQPMDRVVLAVRTQRRPP